MGNQQSITTKDSNVFEKELSGVNAIVNSIINEKDLFKNRDYNFLSQDVCSQHYVLMESELNRHLKINIQNLGTSLYLIPKDREAYTSQQINKKEICKKISHHYMKVLYILCLIKYVYNLEKNGDMSIAGIVFRNIRFVDNIMEINFCNVPQKDYSKSLKDAYKMDFGRLEGLRFLTSYFLDKKEALAFVRVMRRVLAHGTKGGLASSMCGYKATSGVSAEHVLQMERMYLDRYGEKLVCKQGAVEKGGKEPRSIGLHMFVGKDNPILSREFCNEIHKYIIQINTPAGKKAVERYKAMKANYDTNLKEVERLLGLLVERGKGGGYTLRNLGRAQLDAIVYKVRDTIKTFYVQSILDFQSLLEVGKKVPNINVIN